MSLEELLDLLKNGYCCHCETLEDREEIIHALVNTEGVLVGSTTRRYADELKLFPENTIIIRLDSGLISAVGPNYYLLGNKTPVFSSAVLPFTDHKTEQGKLQPADFTDLYDWF